MPEKPIPYKGPRPYEEADKDNFFGREGDTQILLDKILTHKLTFLFAASGVGKSSLLQAAVIPALKTEGRRGGLDVIYHRDWVLDKSCLTVDNLKHTVENYLRKNRQISAGYKFDPALRLDQFLQDCTVFTSEPLVIILDQFEEFFNYQRFSEHFPIFVEQLANAILDQTTATAFVIAMREDFALELNAFKEHIPLYLIDNFYRLEKLTQEKAKSAIVKPVKKLGFRYEEELLEELLKDLSRREQEERYGSQWAEQLQERTQLWVEPPHLQIICEQLWDTEWENPDKLLRLQVYTDKGGAKGILKDYFARRMAEFSPKEVRLASLALDYLVNEHGMKIPYPVSHLAQKLGVEESVLTAVLEKLDGQRVLHKYSRENKLWFELYHDIFAKIVSTWNREYKRRQWQKKWGIRIGAVVTVGPLVVLVVVLGYDGWQNVTQMHFRLSPKSGISDVVEVYQGQVDSFDFFGQQEYRCETDYTRQAIEVDQLFYQQPIMKLTDLDNELIAKLPSKDKIAAYADSGEFNKLIEISSSGRQIAWENYRIPSNIEWNTKKWLEQQAEAARKAQEQQAEAARKVQEQRTEATRETQKSTTQKEDCLTSVKNVVNLETGSDPVDAVLKLLHNDTVEANRVMDALECLGDPKAAFPLLGLFDNPNFSVREQASKLVGKFAGAEVVEHLIGLTKSNTVTYYTRLSAIAALGSSGRPEVMPFLVALLKDASPAVRQSAVRALGNFANTDSVRSSLKTLLNDENPDVRISTSNVLVPLGDVDALKTLLKDDNPLVREKTLEALASSEQFNKEQHEQIFMDRLEDENWDVRVSAVDGLAKLKSTKAVKKLISLLEDDYTDNDYEVNVLLSVVRALGQIGDTTAVQPLLDLVRSKRKVLSQGPTPFVAFANKRTRVFETVFEALQQLGQVQPLIPLLQDDNPDVRRETIKALGQLGDSSAIQPLIPLLQDDNPDVHRETVKVLGQLGDSSAVQPLIDLLKDENSDVRRETVEVLGQLRSGVGEGL